MVMTKNLIGVVEAVENSNGNVIAVQFHPEIFAAEGKQPYLNIFTYLIEKAKNKDDLNWKIRSSYRIYD